MQCSVNLAASKMHSSFDVDGCNSSSNMEQRAEHGAFLMSSSMLNRTKPSSDMIWAFTIGSKEVGHTCDGAMVNGD